MGANLGESFAVSDFADDGDVGGHALVPGFVLWIAYGVATGTPALVVPNTVAVLVAVSTIVVTVRLRDSA